MPMTALARAIALLGAASAMWAAPAMDQASGAAASPRAHMGTAVGRSNNSEPSWAKGIGKNITVRAPASAKPGLGSPAGAVMGEVDALKSGKSLSVCPYTEPSFQATCRQQLKGEPKSDLPTFKNFAIGYVVIDGKKALVGATGTVCVPDGKPKCTTNRNPAAIFITGKPFNTLWDQAVAAGNSSSTGYSLEPCTQVGKNWYNYVPPGS